MKIANQRGNKGYSEFGSTYSIRETRLYLQSYATYIYPLCPLEICNDSVEDLVRRTLTNTRPNSELSPLTLLCVYIMLALGEALCTWPRL